MNQRQLECFIATARCRSLSQAAQELFLTQPGVTYQANSLKKELGEPLFDRTANGMRLNEAGRPFMSTAEKILNTMQVATAQFKSRRPTGRNTVKVLHCVDINDCLWREALAEYARVAPQVEVLTTCSPYKDEFDFLPADVYEFHPTWRCSHEAQLSMFSYGGVYISHGPHLNLARDLVRVPFAPGTPRIDVMLCSLNDEARGPASDFAQFLRDYYREHAGAFDPMYA